MSSSQIPDCVSTAYLMSMLDAKISTNEEASDNVKGDMKDVPPEELVEFVCNTVDTAQERTGTPFLYKLIADYCLFQLQQWNEFGYTKNLEEDHPDIALMWARDAGQIQAMQKTLREINCGHDDFQCPDNSCEE